MTEREQFLGQIDHLANSHALHGSESLCKLLRYLAKHALDHPGVSIKEFQIATEVFGRSPDFDPQLDSMVRVQAGRLRSKLAEYYASDGSEDPIAVALPRGTYVLSFHDRPKGLAKPHNGAAPADAVAGVLPISKTTAITVLLASIFLSATLAVIGTVGTIRKPSDSSASRADPPPAAAFEILWRPFIIGVNEPWVVFSNGSFIGRPETGLRYYDPAKDSGSPVWDHYTGVGEVLAVHNLDQMFGSLHRSIQVKRGSLVELDDVKNNDLVFIGSPSENLTLMDIPGTREFVFERLTAGPRKGDLAIVNLHPEGNETAANLASPSNSPLTEDYSIVALLPGLNPSHSIMILAGTTTFGTQGAVEFVCRRNLVEELLQRLSVSKMGEVTPFEALLRVKVARGVPVQTELVALRKRISQ